MYSENNWMRDDLSSSRRMSHPVSSAILINSSMSLFMSLDRLQVTWHSPTLPEISSFPRNSKKSVTLSRTATLQWRQRKTRVEENRWHEEANIHIIYDKYTTSWLFHLLSESKITLFLVLEPNYKRILFCQPGMLAEWKTKFYSFKWKK